MRALLQRVASARVIVDGAVVGEIGRGLLVFLGVDVADTATDQAYIVNRVLSCRLFESADGKAWGASAAALRLPVLVVSQFTLGANCKKPKPSFHRAMPSDRARVVYESTLEAFRAVHPAGSGAISAGQFQAMMQVHLVNDGPVTVLIDSKNRDDVVPGQHSPGLEHDDGCETAPGAEAPRAVAAEPSG
jgi:D-aminoacyl-tRNA deacylase